ncbi:RNA polymerase sigma-B factor [Kitasatospora sp. GP30]|uniref:SigB/SigF/SigG family RNA polymerase sigma factor n=1 Tax=Kitasatospora sp. GP30 TaxID=3035084 RepID=UPI000C702D1E|nr:SigB/SigF/SigG family RNA polymerase sigma factor [Kitasatospora sp. GP30]MDH6143493.1 RNA polymerase sigma-B factor [Kitasatospora sp. GP30]
MAMPTTVAPEIEPSTGADSGFSARRHGLPEITDPLAVSTGEARELSRVLLLRLRKTEQGTELHSYVRATLIELNVSLVKFAARRFRSSHESMDDIIQTGTVGLIKAIDRFDPDRGVEFTTFALPTIVGEIRRFFRDSTWAVHVPRRLQEARLAVVRGSDELEQDLGRAPSTEELAEHVALPQDEVVEALEAATARTATSLDAPSDDRDASSAWEIRLGCCDRALAVVEYVQSLKPLIAALPERERTILALRFTQDLTQAEIGQRLGISQMHVSRLLAHSFQVLRAGLADGQDTGSEPAHGG